MDRPVRQLPPSPPGALYTLQTHVDAHALCRCEAVNAGGGGGSSSARAADAAPAREDDDEQEADDDF